MYAIQDEIPIANAVRDGNHQRNQWGNRRQGNGARIRGRGFQHNINNPQLAFPNEDRIGRNQRGGNRGGGNRGGGYRGGGNRGGGNRGGGNRGGWNRGGGNRGGGNPHNQNQMRNQMRGGNEVVLNTPRQNFDDGNIGAQQGGERRSHWRGIGYKKLLDWSMVGDADNLIMNVLVSKFELEELLKKDDLKDDWIVLLIQVFKTLCEGRKSENRNALIYLLCSSKFLKDTIQKKLLIWGNRTQIDGHRSQEISDNLTVIFRLILNVFPSSTLDIPLDVFKTFVTSRHDIIYEENEMEELFEQRTKFLDKLDGNLDSRQRNNRNDNNVADDNKNPPECYRELSTIPRREDIMEENPFLRKIKRDGAYTDGEHYLDIQFRLLREDLICPLRTGIMEILNDVDKEERKMNVKVYEGVNYMYGEYTNNGLIHKISFNITNHKGVPWKHSRRFLFGSLLCLTKDKFLTFIFATVANRDVKELENGILSIRLENSIDLKYFDNANTLVMIESASYFEAYKHVLDAMKEIQGEEIPMYRYIVKCNAEIQPPAYILDQPQKRYDLQGSLGITPKKSANVDVLNEKSWPSAVDTELNHSQLEAFKHALTKEFVLIQGPPGTGKTHVGLRIAHALLQNQFHQNKPMLIVCYTNHALDQFLTGLIEFGHTNIIRVGGRCSQELMEYNLRNRSIRLMTLNKNLDKKNQDEDFKEIKRLRQAKHVPFSERKDMIEVLSNKMINSKTTEMALKEGEFISFEQLSKYMSENHRRWLEQYDVACKQLNLSVFDIFLNIINLPPDDLYNIEQRISVKRRDDENVEHEDDIEDADEDNFIDVEGEAERLTDLYVLDENLYKTKKNKKQREKRNKSEHNIKLVDRDGFEYILPQRKTRKNIFRKEFNKHEKLADEVVEDLYNPWDLDYESRWKLYKYWVSRYKDLDLRKMEEDNEGYEGLCRQVREVDELEDAIILRTAEVVAMTTTGAAKYRNVLKNINPAIVIVEEAAEVLETHVLASLNHDVEQLILIGDHQQLQPNPSVHKLAVNYGLDISLFQRMINNNLECHTLQIQHRMRPEISRFMRHIYKRLDDHSSVWNYNCVRGVSKNVFFVDIKGKEEEMAQMKSKINKEEALYIRELCLYLLKNGYKPSEITILTGYAGQVIQFKKIMEKELFNGVRVTAVDNYQGEENKIILLSLVRSDKIGFWKKDNRVCVALSRAKEGLFVVGNFNLFTTNSELWKKIIADAQENDLYGEYLVLYCQNHARKQTIISKYTDFKKVPEGGCMESCLFRLKCGHVCEKVCHPLDTEHTEYVCRKRCGKKVCLLNHICQRRCHYGDTCGECLFPVDKTIPECGHVQRVQCKDDVSMVKCQAKCQKVRNCGHPCQGKCLEDCEEQKCTFTSQKMLPCGHVGIVPCFQKEEDFKCQKACDAHLKCFHKCGGTCSSCKHGRLHRRCEQKCDRDLPCNHLCKDKCTKNCPPCSLPCENVCGHSMCMKKCGEICSPCTEPCLWRCQHKQCTNPCYDLCDRDPCNEPCQKFKRCGHRCIGLCGEPCPSLCRVCNKDDVEEIFFGTEDEPDSLFIELEDCKHILEVEGLDHWMSLKDDSAEVMLKKCPKCKQVIRRSVRYGNIIKIIMKDIENIKRMVSYGDDFIETQQTAYRKCRELNNIFLNKQEIGNNLEQYLILQEKDRLEDFLKTKPKESKGDPIPHSLAARLYLCIRDHAVRIINQADFLIKIEKHLVDSINGRHGQRVNKEFDRENILNEIENLRQYTIYWNINEEQFENAFVEFKRINVHINTMLVYQQLHKDTAFLKSEKFKKFERRTMKLLSPKLLDEQWLEKMKRFVDAIKTEFHCDGIPKEELNMVVQAMGFTKGHWFKCRNGHFYCIGECGGAMETAVCPECKEVIGGNNHALASGNRHASEVDNARFAAYSEQANDPRNWDPRQLAELQRW